MLVRYDTIEGACVFKEDTQMHGLVTGNAEVRSGVTLDLHGTVGGDLEVAHGAHAIVRGKVCGVVWVSGSVDLHGAVGDLLFNAAGSAARSVVQPNAVVTASAAGPQAPRVQRS